MTVEPHQEVAFIGTGVMGASMAKHLMDAGHKLRVFNRTREKANALVEQGAVWCDSPGVAASNVDIAISMVGMPEDVENIYLGADGIVESAKSGTLLIDMTTSHPLLAQRIADAAKANNCEALDAPVSGGDIGARDGKLSIMAGGSDDAYQRALPLFSLMGKNIHLQGGPGAGQHTKMANQIAGAAGMLGMCESLSYARKAGLDPSKVLESISQGAAGSWALLNLAPRTLQGDYSPGFFVRHFVKDLRIALDSAKEMKLELPGLELAKRLYEKLLEEGDGDCGTQALMKLYR